MFHNPLELAGREPVCNTYYLDLLALAECYRDRQF